MKILINGIEREFENRFGFYSYNERQAYLEKRKSSITLSQLISGNYVIFTTEKTLRNILKSFEIPKENISENSNGRVIGIIIGNCYFKNFNEICGYANLEKLSRDFDFKGSEIDIMKSYIDFLRKNKLKCNEIAFSTHSTICEIVFYKKVGDELFYMDNNNLPKTKKEREVIFNYFKQALIERNGMVYGVLSHKKGYYENVLRIDLNNFYGYQLITKQFLEGHPYQVLTGMKEAKWDYLPDKIRQAVLHNYKTSKDSSLPVGIRRFFKGCNNMTIGRSENLGIYLRRTRKSKRNFLQPQHGFQVILYGIDDMETYMKLFEQYGGTIIKADTDGLAIAGFSEEEGKKMVEAFNKVIVERLLAAGLTEEDAQCGIGQFKIEGYSAKYYQFGDKAYCFSTENGYEITFSGMSESRKKEILESSNSFEEIVEKLKNEKPKKQATIIDWEDEV